MVEQLQTPDCSPDRITTHILKAGINLHRVHLTQYEGTDFNPSTNKTSRFSAIFDQSGQVIPTIYLAQHYSSALLETVFHNIPYDEPDKFLNHKELVGRSHSVVTLDQDIELADLTNKALHKLRINPDNVVTTNQCGYHYSRKVAESIYNSNPSIQGLRWMSRRDDTAQAYMLFGTRLTGFPIRYVCHPRPLLVGEAYDELLSLAEQLDVQIVPPTII